LIQEEIKLWKVSNQFDLKNTNIPSSKTVIEFISGLYKPLTKRYRAGYLASDYGSNRLSVINNPELDGTKL
jgi:hypothetical protein